MNASDILFEALADPTRRAAVAALIERPLGSSALARTLHVTPQALTRHLRLLRKAGLAQVDGDEADARRRIYRVDPAALDPLRDWLADADRMWSVQLAAFKAHAESDAG